MHDGRGVEIAESRDSDDVAEDAALGCFFKDALVKFGGGCGCDDQKHVFQIARLERARKPLDTVRLRPGAHLRGRLGRHHAYAPAGLQEAGDFRLGDRSRSDDEAPPGRELEEHGEELCRLHVFKRRAPRRSLDSKSKVNLTCNRPPGQAASAKNFELSSIVSRLKTFRRVREPMLEVGSLKPMWPLRPMPRS